MLLILTNYMLGTWEAVYVKTVENAWVCSNATAIRVQIKSFHCSKQGRGCYAISHQLQLSSFPACISHSSGRHEGPTEVHNSKGSLIFIWPLSSDEIQVLCHLEVWCDDMGFIYKMTDFSRDRCYTYAKHELSIP